MTKTQLDWRDKKLLAMMSDTEFELSKTNAQERRLNRLTDLGYAERKWRSSIAPIRLWAYRRTAKGKEACL